PLVMLPGLIHSTVNVFNYLAAPVLLHMLEASLEQFVIRVDAYLAQTVEFQRWVDFKRIVWATLKRQDGEGYEAHPNVADASNISSITYSHGFIEVPPNKHQRTGLGRLSGLRSNILNLDGEKRILLIKAREY
ncbi:MAG: hypothetical protein QW815_04745, partial [Nitrososphaerota archaeon]